MRSSIGEMHRRASPPLSNSSTSSQLSSGASEKEDESTAINAIYDGAYLRVVFFVLILTLECCSNVMCIVTRDTIFMKTYSVDYIPYMTILTSCINAIAAKIAVQLMKQMGGIQIVAPLFQGLACGIALMFWSVLSWAQDTERKAIVMFMYIWIEVHIQINVMHFWELCSTAFDIKQSKKFFGHIAFGSTLGTLCTGFVLIPYLQYMKVSTENNLLWIAGILLIVGTLLFLFGETILPEKNAPETSTTSTTKSTISGLKAGETGTLATLKQVRRRLYLQHLCVFEVVATIARVLVDFQTLSAVSDYPETLVKETLGLINGVQSCLMTPLQIISSTVFTKYGVMHGMAAMPAATIMFGVITGISSERLTVVFSRGIYNATTYTIFSTSRELLWLPLNDDDKTRMKPFLAGPVRSTARIAGAFISIILNASGTGHVIEIVRAISILLGIGWLVDTFAARKAYGLEFYSSIKRGHMDFSSPHVDILPNQIQLIKEILNNGSFDQIRFVLRNLPSSFVSSFTTELRKIFYGENTLLTTRLQILDLHVSSVKSSLNDRQLQVFSVDDLLPIMTGLSKNVSPQLRNAAILACSWTKRSKDQKECICVLKSILGQVAESEELLKTQLYACIALLRLTQWMDASAHVRLQRMLHDESNIRIVALKLVGKELPELLGNGYLVYLLYHPSAGVIHAALEACKHASRNSRILIPPLLQKASKSEFRVSAVEALEHFDPARVWEELVPYLRKAIKNLQENRKTPEEMYHVILGCMRILSTKRFPVYPVIDLTLSVLSHFLQTEAKLPMSLVEQVAAGWHLPILEEVVDGLLKIMEDAALGECSSQKEKVEEILLAVLRQAHEAIFVEELVCEHYPLDSMLLLFFRDIRNLLNRIALKLCSLHFPISVEVNLIIEGLESGIDDASSVIQEVLENVLVSSHKPLVLPLFFPDVGTNTSLQKFASEFHEVYGENAILSILNSCLRGKNEALMALSLEHALRSEDIKLLELLKLSEIPELLERKLSSQVIKLQLSSQIPSADENVIKYMDKSFQDIMTSSDHSSTTLSLVEMARCLSTSTLFQSVGIMELVMQATGSIRQLVVQTDETFVFEGSIGTEMFIIVDGSVEVHRSGKELTTLTVGQCVGGMALLRHMNQPGVQPVSATAITECTLLAISRDTLDDFMHDSNAIARGLLDVIASALRWTYIKPVEESENGDSLLWKNTLHMASQAQLAMTVNAAAEKWKGTLERSKSLDFGDQKKPLLERCMSQRYAENLVDRLNPMLQSSASQPFLGRRKGTFRPPEDSTILERCLYLKGTKLFRELDDDQVALVAQLTMERRYEDGDLVYSEGKPADELYVLINGCIDILIRKQSDSSSRVVERYNKPGNCFGELSFVRGAVNIGSASSKGSSSLLVLSSRDFIELAEERRHIMRVLVSWLAQEISQRTFKITHNRELKSTLSCSSSSSLESMVLDEVFPSPLTMVLSPRSSIRNRSKSIPKFKVAKASSFD